MVTFDSLIVRRPHLARGYLELLAGQPARPLALFARRRVGKTFFLWNDLREEALSAGLLPVYVDVLLHRDAPLAAINHALEEALDDATVPRTPLGKTAKTAVRKVGALGASVELGDEPKRRPLPEEAPFRFDALVGRLAAAAGKRLLLMLDEIQAVGSGTEGSNTMASIRAVLQQRQREVLALFTGSSQDSLAAMMVSAGAPMYQFAQLQDFPPLGDEYLEMLAKHFSKVRPGFALDFAALQSTFTTLAYKPALIKDLVKGMAAEGATDIVAALRRFARDPKRVDGWRAQVAELQPLERLVLSVIASGTPPLGQHVPAQFGRVLGGKPPTAGRVRMAVERLRRAGILLKPASTFELEDPLLAGWLRERETKEILGF